MRGLIWLASVNAQEEVCTPQSLRLWIHQDFTTSFGQFAKDIPQFLISTLDQIREEVKDFDIGVSIFRDRETDGFGCWEMVTDFLGADRYDEACAAITKLSGEKPWGNYNTPEDSLSAIPVLANKHLNKLDPADLNILIIITDSPGKLYPGEYEDAGDKDQSEVDYKEDVICDSRYKFLTAEQAFGDLKKLPVAPYTLAIPVDSEVDTTKRWWTDAYSSAGYECDQEQCGVQISEGSDSGSIVAGLIHTFRKASCSALITTPPPTTTSAAHPPTAATAVPPLSPGEEESRKKVIIPVAVASGGAAIVACGLAAIRMLRGAPATDIDSIAVETTAEDVQPTPNRDTAILLDDTQFT